ncbi:MAG: hypothetical protein P3B98_10835 [Gemmatimonadota bacterium]|nr:hypothetical protein [Gemmatimonadota bacterium]
MSLRIRSAVLAACCAAAPLVAQQLPAVRPLGAVTKVSPADLLGSVSSVRPLPGGGAVVNDLTRRQLVVLDAEFKLKSVIADTTPATANSYSSRIAGLMAYKGDSSLFVDPASLSMLVIDGAGEVVRVMAVPRPEDANFMIGGPFGTPGVDPQGRIVYRGFVRPNMRGMNMGGPPQPGQAFRAPQMADTAPVYRVSLASRALDTAAYFKIPSSSVSMTQDDKGAMRITVKTNPMPVVDDWALMPDGRIAVVRGKDYHIDFLGTDGSWTSTPKIPYNWERLDDDAKEKFLDSAKVEAEKQRENISRAMQNGVAGVNQAMAGMAGPGGGGGGMRIEMRIEGGPGGGARPQQGVQQISAPSINFVDKKELPDYRPAFRQGSVRADLSGNLWIRTTAPTDAGAIYDVVNDKGELIDRVKLPFGRVISGFGTDVVYMGVQDDTGARLEMAKIR